MRLKPTRMHKQVVAQFKELLEKYKVVSQGEKPVVGELVPEPILNWDDIERGHFYGTLWIWGQKGRPTGMIEIYTVDLEKKVTGWPRNVCHSLSTEAVRPEGPRWNWSPDKPGLKLQKLDVPEPAASSKLVESKCGALAKRFTSDEIIPGAASFAAASDSRLPVRLGRRRNPRRRYLCFRAWWHQPGIDADSGGRREG